MKKRTHRQFRFICIIALLITAFTFAYSNFTTKTTVVTREITYVVENNDTLWNIAAAFNINDEDPRELIYDIKEFNNIGSTIYPGQTIIIPVKSSIDISNSYQLAANN